MAAPFQPTEGSPYYLKQRVPADLASKVKGLKLTLPVGETFVRVRVGEAIQVSLRTKDSRESVRLLDKAMQAFSRYEIG